MGGILRSGVGVSHFLLRNNGLEKSKIDQILLLVKNDLGRYEEIKTRLASLAKSQQPSQLPGSHGNYGRQHDSEPWASDSDWTGMWWWWCDDDTWTSEAFWQGEDWHEDSWGYDDDHDDGLEYFDEAGHDPESEAYHEHNNRDWTFHGKGKKGKGNRPKGHGKSLGKGKSKGKKGGGNRDHSGCGSCGSPNHGSADCPWADAHSGGKSKGFGKDPRKGQKKAPSEGQDGQGYELRVRGSSEIHTCRRNVALYAG